MAITMKNLNDRISTLEGKASTTPITMKGLSDRLDNIEATAKKWEEGIITIPSGTQVQNTISRDMPNNLKELYDGSSKMQSIAGTLWFGSGSETLSASGGSLTYDKNKVYYRYNRVGVQVKDTVTIKLVFYK